MRDRLRGPGNLLNETLLLAVLLVTFVVVAVVFLVVQVAREVRKWRKLRALLREWSDEHEKRESA
ncbi:MAG: hypothetical protein M3Y56_07360 [Armatimonadota bacterium]|nr:hypothetical protein [Armatimonadota bacterium]